MAPAALGSHVATAPDHAPWVQHASPHPQACLASARHATPSDCIRDPVRVPDQGRIWLVVTGGGLGLDASVSCDEKPTSGLPVQVG